MKKIVLHLLLICVLHSNDCSFISFAFKYRTLKQVSYIYIYIYTYVFILVYAFRA